MTTPDLRDDVAYIKSVHATAETPWRELATAALQYAEQGVPVFPCIPRGKAPLTRHGHHEATTDHRIVQRWWRWCPDANIGMPTGTGTWDVLDVDVRDTGDGGAALARLADAGILAGAGRLVATPSGGRHLYFTGSHQPCGRLPGKYLDFKATGGYVVVPPSTVTSDNYNGRYRVLDQACCTGSLNWTIVQRLLAPHPKPGAGAVGERSRARRSSHPLVRWVEQRPEGNRNAGVYWAACQALRLGRDDILDDLAVAAESTGLGSLEVASTIASATRSVRNGRAS